MERRYGLYVNSNICWMISDLGKNIHRRTQWINSCVLTYEYGYQIIRSYSHLRSSHRIRLEDRCLLECAVSLIVLKMEAVSSSETQHSTRIFVNIFVRTWNFTQGPFYYRRSYGRRLATLPVCSRPLNGLYVNTGLASRRRCSRRHQGAFLTPQRSECLMHMQTVLFARLLTV
jgi:hypothetical protein